MRVPFISFVTRCCDRPEMLETCIRSVETQKDDDWEHIFLLDRQRHGDIVWANRQLHKYREYVQGKWVFILDDDCMLTDSEFVSSVKAVAKVHSKADMIMVRSSRPQWEPTVVPTPDLWGKENEHRLSGKIHNHINCLTYVVKRKLWQEKIGAFDGHSGARTFFQALIETNPRLVWVDRDPMSETQQLGRAKRFEKVSREWFEKIVEKHDLERVIGDVWRTTE